MMAGSQGDKSPLLEEVKATDMNLQADNDDQLDGVLYHVYPSEKTHSVTIRYYSDGDFAKMNCALNKLYAFTQSKGKTGHKETYIKHAGRKVVINVHARTRTLHIQGAGCNQWSSEVFPHLANPYNNPPEQNEIAPSLPNTNSPPIIHIDEGQTISAGDFELTCVKEEHKENVADQNSLVVDMRDNGPTESLLPSSVSVNTCDDDVTFVKQTSSTAIHIPSDDDISGSDQTMLKQVCSDQTTLKQVYSPTGELDTMCVYESEPVDQRPQVTQYLNMFKQKQEIEKRNSQLLKDNKELQSQIKEMLTSSKALRQHNSSLNNEVKSLKLEVSTVLKNNEAAQKASSEYTAEITKLKATISDMTGQLLVKDEQNEELKRKIKNIQEEKTKLVDELMRANQRNDGDQIGTELNDLKHEVMTELKLIKDQLSQQQTVIENTLKQPENHTHNGNAQWQKVTNNKTHQNSNPNTNGCTAFIAGDSMTRILSRQKLCDANLDVKVRSLPGGRVRTVENTILKMADDDPDFIRTTRAVVLHVGTNNISDGDMPASVVDEIRDTVDSIKNINPEAKIIISSILPRRNDKLLNRIITDTNSTLEEMCQAENYSFINNDAKFKVNDTPDSSLYADHIHLNPKGGKLLGENIRYTINKILKLPTLQEQSSRHIRDQPNVPFSRDQMIAQNRRYPMNNGQQPNFLNGRYPGRRRFDHNMVHSPMSYNQPPWFNNQREIFNNDMNPNNYVNYPRTRNHPPMNGNQRSSHLNARDSHLNQDYPHTNPWPHPY
ncbi:MAG: GDSL-type esterase/lipase family protein [Sedimenticola sp.]